MSDRQFKVNLRLFVKFNSLIFPISQFLSGQAAALHGFYREISGIQLIANKLNDCLNVPPSIKRTRNSTDLADSPKGKMAIPVIQAISKYGNELMKGKGIVTHAGPKSKTGKSKK